MYEFFKQNFNVDEVKARVFAEEIEQIVENKFEKEKDKFAATSAVDKREHKIDLLQKDMQIGFSELKSELRAEFNRQIIWLVGLMVYLSGIIIAVIKFLF